MTSRHQGELGQVTSMSDPLFDELRDWRNRTARSLRMKPYYIFNDETLLQIVRIRPSVAASLEAIRGMGPKKVARWGSAILAIVEKHRGDRVTDARVTRTTQAQSSDAELTFACEAEIRNRRFEQANRDRVPAFHNLMRRIARRRPQTLAELSSVYGVGSDTLKRSGRWIVAITRKYPPGSPGNL